MTTDRPSHSELAVRALAVLEGGSQLSAPSPPWASGHGYPLARDVHEDLAAVSFAVRRQATTERDAWACTVMLLTRASGAWHPADTYDDSTTAQPFERPEIAENSSVGWVDWPSTGPAWGHGETAVLSCFGVAPAGTARLELIEDGIARPLEITPFNGAYVAVSRSRSFELRGIDATGADLGTLRLSGDDG